MDVDRVLAPIDGSDRAAEAFEYALAIADRYDASVHALFVLGEEVARGVRTGDLHAGTVADETSDAIERARQHAVDAGVPFSRSSTHGYSPTRLTQHPGSVIVEVAEQIDADFIALPREPVTGDPEAVIEKAAQYVLAHADPPVLSV